MAYGPIKGFFGVKLYITLPSELHVMTRYYMSVHVMTDDAEYWHLHLQAFTRHLKTKKKRVQKQLQLAYKKNTRNNMYFPGPLTCNFSLTFFSKNKVQCLHVTICQILCVK